MLKRLLAIMLSASLVISSPITTSAVAEEMSFTEETDLTMQNADYPVTQDAATDENVADIPAKGVSAEEENIADQISKDDPSIEDSEADDSVTDGEEDETVDDETESEEPASDEDADAEDEASDEDVALEEEVVDVPDGDESSLQYWMQIPDDYMYDGIHVSPLDDFNHPVLYMAEMSETKAKKFTFHLKNGNDYYTFSNTAELSELLNEDISATVYEKLKVETCLYSSGEYIVVTGDESPLNISFEEDENRNLSVCMTSNSSFPEGKYYLRFTFDFPEHIRNGKKIEKLVRIIKAPINDTLYDSKEAACAAVREVIRNRVNNIEHFDDASNHFGYDNFVYDRIYVAQDAYPEGTIRMLDVCDFEAERDGMEPYEGDYIYNLLGNRIQRTFYFEDPCRVDQDSNTFGTKTVDGKDYFVYEIYLPVITTKAEENAVDEAVENLMNTTFADVINGTNQEKIRKVFDYVTKHVSGTVSGAGGSDRTYPLYHTAYHALIKKNGTCESFAQLFTRLTRELGVPSRVIMGMDAANHTYNIVDGGDGYWYYIDCSAGKYLTDSKNFKRATEQERFTTPKFVINYLQKIKGGTDIDVSTIKVLDKNGIVVFSSVELYEVKNYIRDMLDDEVEGPWTIRLDSNWTVEYDDFRFFNDNCSDVILDLNSHKLICKGMTDFELGTVKNGTIQVGYKNSMSSISTTVTIDQAVLENVTIQGVTGVDQLIVRPIGSEVTFSNVTLKKLDVLMNYDADASYTGYMPDNPSDVFVDGTLKVDNCYFYEGITEGQEFPIIRLTQNAHIEFSGTTIFGGWDYGDPPYSNYQGSVPNDYFPVIPIEFVPAEEGRYFESGDVIATYSGTLKKFTSNKNAKSAAVLTDIVAFSSTSSHKDLSDTSLGLSMMDKSLIFITTWLKVSVYNDEDPEEPLTELGQFVKWSDAISAIDRNGAGLKATDYKSYKIELTASGDIMQKMTFPKKASSLSIDSEPGEHYTLTHRGDIAPTLLVGFSNITLTTPESVSAKLVLGGNMVTFLNACSANTYSQISGKAGSHLYLFGEDEDNYVLSSKGAISVGELLSDSYRIESLTGAITVQGDAILESTEIDAATNVSFKNIYSCDGNNSIAYGEGVKNTFKISGNVSEGGPVDDVMATDEEGKQRLINSCAMSITNKYMEKTRYEATKCLVSTTKAPSCFFVVDKYSEADVWNVRYTTRKLKSGIYINNGAGEAESAVVLNVCNNVGDKRYTLGYFDDLAGAFAEIKAINNVNARYLITIDGTKKYGKRDISLDAGNISTPTQTAALFIKSLDEEIPAYLHVGGEFTLGSPVTLEGVRIARIYGKNKAPIRLNINLGKHRLKLVNVDLSDGDYETPDDRIGKITGNGVNGSSALEISGSGIGPAYWFAVNGDLSNVGELYLREYQDFEQNIIVTGKTKVGNVKLERSSSFESYVTIKKNKAGQIISVTSPIEITGKLTGDHADDLLYISLYEKTADGPKSIALAKDGEGRLAYTEPLFNLLKPAFQIVKAPIAESKRIRFNIGGKLIRKNGSFYLVSEDALNEHGFYSLHTKFGKLGSVDFGDYVTFADVVWDINSIKDKTAPYWVVCEGGNTAEEGQPAEIATAEKFVMPKANTLSDIFIEARSTCALKYSAGTKITLNCHTEFSNIRFVSEGYNTRKLKLNLGGNRVDLTNTYCVEGFGDITGNGVNKTSELDVCIDSSDRLVVAGNLSNVGKVTIQSDLYNNDPMVVPELVVYGSTNVGSLVKGPYSVFTGSAALKYSNAINGVAWVSSNVTIANKAGTYRIDEDGFVEHEPSPEFDFTLVYKYGDDYVPVLGTGEGSYSPAQIPALDGNSFMFMKTTNINPGQTAISYTGYADQLNVVKNKNSIYLKRK